MFAATGLRLSTADSFCTHPVTVIAADAFFCSLAGDEEVCAAAVTPHTMTAATTDVDHRFMLMSHLSIHSRGDSWNQCKADPQAATHELALAPSRGGQAPPFGSAGIRLANMDTMRRRAPRRLAIPLLVAGLVLAGTPARDIAAADAAIHCGIEMRNLLLRVADGVVLQVAALDGEFVSHSAGQPPVFDDPNSYTLRIKSADMQLDGPSLTNLFQQSAKAHPSPLSDVKITIEGGQLKAEGKLKKGVTVPFSMTATVAATPDGMLRLHSTKLKAVGVPVKGLFDLLGLKVDDLMKMPPGSG